MNYTRTKIIRYFCKFWCLLWNKTDKRKEFWAGFFLIQISSQWNYVEKISVVLHPCKKQMEFKTCAYGMWYTSSQQMGCFIQLFNVQNLTDSKKLFFVHNKPASKRFLRLNVSSTSLKVFFTSFWSRAVVL